VSSRFVNERHLELRRADVRDALLAAGEELRARLPVSVPVLVGDDARAGAELASVDPGEPAVTVALAPLATEADVDAAVAAAGEHGREWARRGPAERARTLVDAAALMRERRMPLAALAVTECAKPWAEADADVCEAIDFLEYYARQALELDRGAELVQPPGERNAMRFRPRGTVAVIAPWNFPLAISTGMVAGALAAGNTVILKPAPQSPACAHAVVHALREAGVPAAALALLPGGDEPGAALVRHRGVHAIAFTGSAKAGTEIVRRAAETPAGQSHVKHVVAEMGGKNCVIVDSDADLDQAVPAIVRSAFAYAGQKCSAAARVLAHEEVLDALLRRLAGAVAALRVGQARELGVDVPPLIDADAQRRVLSHIERGAAEGGVREQVAPPGGTAGAFFVPPTLLTDLPCTSPLLCEEVFGPVLTVEAVRDIAAACDVVDRLPFALTGGLFSRNPASVRYVVERSPVGNLYVNREITGAMVSRQPFGGNRLSGTGAKAGGPGYVLEFCESHVVCENTTRHGLVL
jgi:RHH-type proline utilization regulon transcriptional repressor/proline dehydrogenase/delta 1-pyrroline-5-carboxylate dehydrogenase